MYNQIIFVIGLGLYTCTRARFAAASEAPIQRSTDRRPVAEQHIGWLVGRSTRTPSLHPIMSGALYEGSRPSEPSRDARWRAARRSA